MLILKYLLFNPLFGVMDKRREKIEAAKSRRLDMEREEAELAERLKAEHKADFDAAKLDSEAKIGIAAEEYSAARRACHAECDETLRSSLIEEDEENAVVRRELDENAEELAKIYAKMLTSGITTCVSRGKIAPRS